ncbi:hypothetical protein ACFQMA_23140 [Halosimplex aquaticum]|uniref:Uncharacterized protein n=1 Tax=Halosimplex aquaticum TaxID=3026162 RepID=A0ABD5Y638_9EURY|nr:hypothetical protein [Halosimplex aquaticum]
MQMSKTDESPSFEDFPETEASDDGDAANWIDLEPGDEVVGLITDFNPDAGRNGLVEIDGRPTWLTAGMKDRIIAALVEGAQIAIRKSEDDESFEDDDGEEVTYYPKEVRVKR